MNSVSFLGRGCDVMGGTLRLFQLNKKLELRITASENLPKRRLLGSLANNSSKKTLRCGTSMKVSMVATGGAGEIAVFLLTTAVLEMVRRFSSANCPFIWRGIQALQVLCFPPFKWIQKWAPFTGLVKGMQSLSRPLMFLSVATGFFDESSSSKGTLSGLSADLTELSTQLITRGTGPVNKVSRSLNMEDWLVELYAELDKQGITIPERINEEELRRFYAVSDGDFAKLLSSVKKSIQWRQKYTLLSSQELEAWANLVFWHGSDVMQRPCLIIRVGVAGSNLVSNGRAQFVRAVVSQVEYGVLNLLDAEHPQLTVLMDCEGLSPFGFPVQTFRSCVVLLQDHYPNRLGCLLVVRLPSVARVITQTLFQVLKPRTQQKLTIAGEDYIQILSRYFEEFPAFLGGKCCCSQCASEVDTNTTIVERTNIASTEVYVSSSSLDINWERLKMDVAAVAAALLMWVILLGVFMLTAYYHKLMFPNTSDS